MEIKIKLSNEEMFIAKALLGENQKWKRFQKRHWQKIFGCKAHGRSSEPFCDFYFDLKWINELYQKFASFVSIARRVSRAYLVHLVHHLERR